MYLLGPFLVSLDDGQTVQLCIARFFTRGVAVQPSIDMNPRPLRLVSFQVEDSVRSDSQRTPHRE